MTDLLTALALLLVIEGLTVAIVPSLPQRLLERLAETSPESLRLGGLVMAVLGVGLVWLLRA